MSSKLLDILRSLLPALEIYAAKTATPLDDIVVQILKMLLDKPTPAKLAKILAVVKVATNSTDVEA